MEDRPLSVVIVVLIQDEKILLIKRKRGEYVGLWGLPGGKIEKEEHLSQAAVREIAEETGIKSRFKSHLGFVSEHLVECGVVSQHFLLHLCELIPEGFTAVNGEEGETEWFSLAELKKHKTAIIPSDHLMIEKMIKNKEKNYYNCIIEKIGGKHFLRRFE